MNGLIIILIHIKSFHRVIKVQAVCNIYCCLFQLLLHLLQHYPTCLSHVLLEENDICDETKYCIRLALGESESEQSSESDDGRCEVK